MPTLLIIIISTITLIYALYAYATMATFSRSAQEKDWINEADEVLNDTTTGAMFVDDKGSLVDVSEFGYSETR